MSIQAVAWAWDQDVPGNAKLVLLALSNHADHASGRCVFDADVVAKQASIKAQSLWRYIGALERNGFVARELVKDHSEFWLRFTRAPAAWDWGRHREDGEADDASEAPAPVLSTPPAPPKAFRAEKQSADRGAVVASAPKPAEFVFVIEDSRAWDAWKAHYKGQGKPMRAPVWGTGPNGRRAPGWYFPTLFPPSVPQDSGDAA